MRSLLERDEAVIWHPFTHQKNRPPVIPIVSGKGSLLFDENGHALIDAISSWWVNLHGHSHPYIAEKLYKQALQLEQVIFAGFTHEPAIVLAESLLKILPAGISRIFYSDNGSTSTEVALKMALQYWWNSTPENKPKRNKIVAFNNSYHGDTFGAMSVSDRSVFTLAFHDYLFEVVFINTPTTENIANTKAMLQPIINEVAAFIYEPLVQGAGGICMYDAAPMNELLKFFQLYHVICIADEVMTGFGRTGKLFASNYLAVEPDIICLSKGLTGGTMALGVTACKSFIYDAFISDDKLKTFFHGHSFTANPLACTAAIASIELLMEETCMQQIEWLCNEINKFATSLKKYGNNYLANIRHQGTILAFEIMKGKTAYLNQLAAPITNFAIEKGVYIRPLGNTVYIMPPYCITENELNKIFNCIVLIIEKFAVTPSPIT
ncbi:MAG: adenosylmethionine--8-amino-7-oxononanoate transaminase [Chitinophagaceae bacterium]